MKLLFSTAVLWVTGCVTAPIKEIGKFEKVRAYKIDVCTVFSVDQHSHDAEGKERPEDPQYFFSCPSGR
jgi:hypothetical protein